LGNSEGVFEVIGVAEPGSGFPNALRLTEHYLQGFGWNAKVDPR